MPTLNVSAHKDCRNDSANEYTIAYIIMFSSETYTTINVIQEKITTLRDVCKKKVLVVVVIVVKELTEPF
jgi:hypothetical protein